LQQLSRFAQPWFRLDVLTRDGPTAAEMPFDHHGENTRNRSAYVRPH
jgi:hypothetical protein